MFPPCPACSNLHLLTACCPCLRHPDVEDGYTVIPNEAALLLPSPDAHALPSDTMGSSIDMLNKQLGTIVRAKEGKMVNMSVCNAVRYAPHPFFPVRFKLRFECCFDHATPHNNRAPVRVADEPPPVHVISLHPYLFLSIICLPSQSIILSMAQRADGPT
ncbi:hypothetical protein FB451DRAFT_1400344 [Mycena latifolia]|nr:hypothetical protein FB451DRAFT_1400344 [Mycena latifolia]